MFMENIFERDRTGEMVSPNDPGYDDLIADIFDTIKTATEMNTCYRTPAEVHDYMGKILVNRYLSQQLFYHHFISTTVNP